MTQEAIEISTTPPLPGLKLVQDVNKALQTIATDFAGPTDPAGLPGCGPYCKWADTANGLLKRRNAANTAWVVEGGLFEATNYGKLLNVQVFSTPGTFTYTPTAGTKSVVVEVVGAGGAGGGAQATTSGTVSVGGGGGSGGYAKGWIVSGFSGVTVTVGAGGVGVLGQAGGNGG